MQKRIIPPILFILLIFIAACDKHNGPPTLSNVSGPDSLTRGDTTKIVISVLVIDPEGADDIDSVYFMVTRPDSTSNNIRIPLNDIGQLGDLTAGDNRFSSGIQAPTVNNRIGNYIFTFYAEDTHGNKSNNPELVINVHDRPNSPPRLSNIIAPDSLIRGDTSYSCFNITAIDPDGLNEVDSVYFVVIRPDGSSNGVHFALNDDGESCDIEVGDSIYSTSVEPPTGSAQLGDYLFTFLGRDMYGNVSDSLTITITVYQRE